MAIDFVLIYETAREDEVAFIKSILEANQINYFVENDHSFYRSGGLPMTVKVEAGQADKTREVLKDFFEK